RLVNQGRTLVRGGIAAARAWGECQWVCPWFMAVADRSGARLRTRLERTPTPERGAGAPPEGSRTGPESFRAARRPARPAAVRVSPRRRPLPEAARPSDAAGASRGRSWGACAPGLLS